MNFKRVLHPEIVLGRRGSEHHQFVYNLCRKLKRGDVTIDPANGRRGFVWEGPEAILRADEFGRQHFIAMHKFQRETRKIYHFNGDFLQALGAIDRDIPIELLPDHFFGYFSFPLNTIQDEQGYVQGAYVFMGTCRELGFAVNELELDEKILWISYIMQDDATFGNLLVKPVQKKMSELLNKQRSADYWLGRHGGATIPNDDVLDKRNKVYITVINAFLYVSSLDPVLLSLYPEENLTKSKKKELSKTSQVTDCTVPVVLVNHNYHKPIRYSVDSTWVDTFLRIQRCGPGLSQYKFVWVREHERHYKKDKENENQEESSEQEKIDVLPKRQGASEENHSARG